MGESIRQGMTAKGGDTGLSHYKGAGEPHNKESEATAVGEEHTTCESVFFSEESVMC